MASVGVSHQVTIKGDQITGETTKGSAFTTTAMNGDSQLGQRMFDHNVDVSVTSTEDSPFNLVNILVSWFPMLLLVGVWIFFPRLRAWMEMPKYRFLEQQHQFPSVLRDRQPGREDPSRQEERP